MTMTQTGSHAPDRPSEFVELRSVLFTSTAGAAPGTAAFYAMSEAAFAALPQRIPKGFERLPAFEISICLLAAHYSVAGGIPAHFDIRFEVALSHAVEAKTYPLSLRGMGERIIVGKTSDIFIATAGIESVEDIEALIPYAVAGADAYDLVRLAQEQVPVEYASYAS